MVQEDGTCEPAHILETFTKVPHDLVTGAKFCLIIIIFVIVLLSLLFLLLLCLFFGLFLSSFTLAGARSFLRGLFGEIASLLTYQTLSNVHIMNAKSLLFHELSSLVVSFNLLCIVYCLLKVSVVSILKLEASLLGKHEGSSMILRVNGPQ